MDYFADLHVHVGCAQNRPVKITASKKIHPNILMLVSKIIIY